MKINRFWYGFPSSIDRIDAVFERPGDGKIVFFRGKCESIYLGMFQKALRWPQQSQ